MGWWKMMNRDLIITLCKRGWFKRGDRLYKVEGDTLKYIELDEYAKRLEMHGMTIEKAIEKGIVTSDFVELLKLF